MRKLLSIVVLIPTFAAAQARVPTWPLDSGSRIRVLSAVFGDQSQIGTLISTRADTVLFRPAANLTPFAVTTSNIVKLDVARGRHQQKAKGALIGFLVGAAGGAALAAATTKPPDCSNGCTIGDLTRGQTAVIGGALGAIGGTLVGTLIGALLGADTWVPVAVPHS